MSNRAPEQRHVTVAMLYPGHAAEDDYPAAERRLTDVSLPVVHTSLDEDAHRIDALLDLGNEKRLADGVAGAAQHSPDAVMWACTSGSFVFGWEGAHAQVAALERAAGVPASSTSIAFIHAARELGLRRVAVAATYPEDVTASFREFLAAGGIEVVALSSRGIITAAEVGTLNEAAVLDFAAAHDDPTADAVFLPDTALHTIDALDALEQRLGKPVLTANQVTTWYGLRRAGAPTVATGLGTLFATPPSRLQQSAR